MLTALHLLEVEVGRSVVAARTPLAAELRLAFWREAIEDLLRGGAGAHPALRVLERAPPSALAGLPDAVDARNREAEGRRFDTGEALYRHLDATDAPFASAAARLLGVEGPIPMKAAGRVLGLRRLLRAGGSLRTPAGPSWPSEWDAAGAGGGLPRARLLVEVERARAALAADLSAWPLRAFPVVAPGALLTSYARGRQPHHLERRMRILAAALRGRP